MPKALAAMSGGVDSAVTAHMLMNAGYETAGINLRLFDGDGCGSEKESAAAKAVAELLSIPFISYESKELFKNEVISRFVKTYEAGCTPNPCVECNRRVKFPVICRIADEKGFDKIATGHYARIEYDAGSGRYLLYKASDGTKDQSYVLYGLNQSILSKTLFPLGTMTKKEVREIADSLSFPNAQKKDSQDICFVPDGDYPSFIERFTGKKREHGQFVHTSGAVLGEHKGIICYTVGQRKGLGLALPHPMFVLKKDTESNRVILCDGPELYRRVVEANDINFIPFSRVDGSLRVKARTRYNQKEQWATLTQTDEDRIRVEFDEPVRAAAPGQSLVMYDGELLIGGGTII
ncbi:MAG: tRNA 2-thiouridine(34) synthase MnmA [Clostridia bacterium]|nr:tRNA 2-thiouridine(34) synthase MnmA [Clostridia bacterium]